VPVFTLYTDLFVIVEYLPVRKVSATDRRHDRNPVQGTLNWEELRVVLLDCTIELGRRIGTVANL
jgi:hypothetical protein